MVLNKVSFILMVESREQELERPPLMLQGLS